MTSVRCHQITDLPDVTLLWLADMGESIPYPWGLEEFVSAAYQTGLFNGSWPESSAPVGDWLDRKFVTHRPSWILRNESFSALIGTDMITAATAFTERAGIPAPGELLGRFKEVVESSLKVPLVVSHNDLHSRNAFMQIESSGLVMYGIDWASIGLSPVGLDGGTLVAGAMIWRDEEAHLIADIEGEMFDEYTNGLTDAGLDHNRDQVRLGYLSNILPYILGYVRSGVKPIGYWIPRFGTQGEEFQEQITQRLRIFMPLFDEAVVLARQM
jgi:hypothetical protein